MRLSLFIAILIGAVPGCGAFHDLELYPLQGPSADGGTCPPSPDMTTPKAKCLAAQGLPGTNLLCTDFPSPQTLTDLTAAGWNFDKFDKSCWAVISGTLQVNSFSSFASSCGFLMPMLSTSGYSSFTLSVMQTVDLNAQKQTAWIYLGIDLATQQLALSTGTNPRQRNLYEVAVAALPNGGSGMYQPLFKITSSLAGGATGWQIESIAVMGNVQ